MAYRAVRVYRLISAYMVWRRPSVRSTTTPTKARATPMRSPPPTRQVISQTLTAVSLAASTVCVTSVVGDEVGSVDGEGSVVAVARAAGARSALARATGGRAIMPAP